MSLFNVEIKDATSSRDKITVSASSGNHVRLHSVMFGDDALIILNDKGVDDLITVLQYWKTLKNG